MALLGANQAFRFWADMHNIAIRSVPGLLLIGSEIVGSVSAQSREHRKCDPNLLWYPMAAARCDLFQLLRNISDPERPFEELHPGPSQRPIADTDKIKAITSWRPRIKIEDTIADTYEDWRQRSQ